MSAAGIDISYLTDAPAEMVPRLRALAGAGWSSFWTTESAASDAVTPLAVAATAVPGCGVGTCVVSAYTRGPALLAMTAASLAAVTSGPCYLGLGASSPNVVTRWNGITYADPLGRVRDTVRFLRRALAGEQVTEEFDTFSVVGFRLGISVPRPPRLLVAALRPRMLRLAGGEADGAVLTLARVRDIPRLAELVGPDREIAAKILLCPGASREMIDGPARRLLTNYLNVSTYRAYMRWLGRAAELEPMWSAWDAGDRSRALRLVPPLVIDDYIITGSEAECQARVEEFIAAGVTIAIIKYLPFGIDMAAATAAGPPVSPARTGSPPCA
jgi:probable F420-dependent oxidoreductase